MSLDALGALCDTLPKDAPKPEPPKVRPQDIVSVRGTNSCTVLSSNSAVTLVQLHIRFIARRCLTLSSLLCTGGKSEEREGCTCRREGGHASSKLQVQRGRPQKTASSKTRGEPRVNPFNDELH